MRAALRLPLGAVLARRLSPLLPAAACLAFGVVAIPPAVACLAFGVVAIPPAVACLAFGVVGLTRHKLYKTLYKYRGFTRDLYNFYTDFIHAAAILRLFVSLLFRFRLVPDRR